MSLVFVDKQFLQQTKENIYKGQGIWNDVKFELERKAQQVIALGPWSVTYHKSPAVSNNKHDFYNEGPYWWCNSSDPEGPYILRDGEYNPDRFIHHETAMRAMAETVMYLSMAGYYLDKSKYTDRAVELISTWFLDEETKMNPHLEYGQAIRGICDGRGIGIIETAILIRVVYAAGFISLEERYQNEIFQLKKWFESYITWLTTSEKGLEEKNHINNHANWWNTQVASFSAFIENEELMHECFERFKSHIIPNQMDVDGSFIDEIKRTNSYSYNHYNLEASTIICEIAYNKGVDLWNFKTSDNKGMECGIKFMLPYLENPFLWNHQQISGVFWGDSICLQLGGLRLNIEKCAEVNKLRGKDYKLIRSASILGPLAVLPGFERASD